MNSSYPSTCKSFAMNISHIYTSCDLWPVSDNDILTRLALSLVVPHLTQVLEYSFSDGNRAVVAGAVCELGTKLLTGICSNWIVTSTSSYQERKIIDVDPWSRDDKEQVGPSTKKASRAGWANSDTFTWLHYSAVRWTNENIHPVI